MNRPVLLLAVGLLGAVPLLSAAPGGKKMVLEGVDRYRVCEAMFEAVRVVLSYRGEQYSPAYIQGRSGAAFRVAGPCPCAPTCSTQMDTPALVKLLGYAVESVTLTEDQRDQVPKLIERIKEEVRAGRPVIVWNAFTNAEWDVVCGFDDEKKQFVGRGSYQGLDDYARADQNRLTEGFGICGFTGALFIGKKTGKLEDRQAERAALEEAVRHARTPAEPLPDTPDGGEPPWRFREGLACYDAWARGFRADPRKVPGPGDRYPLSIYRSTHRAAADFLHEIAAKHPRAKAHLERAAEHFAADADCLDECYWKLMQGWEGWKEPDPAKAARAAALLGQARDHYAQEIAAIERALASGL
ncbi:MAG: hypothetical protein GX774_13950 [Armatimonadetes bacterium]|nr:hypothetical protein [Armatimonadota bacterium]